MAATARAYRRLAPALGPLMTAFEAAVAPGPAQVFRRSFLELPPGPLLDLGAGTGRQLASLSPSRRADAVALDLVEASLRRLRRHQRATPAVVGDAHRLPFADGSFGAVLAGWVFEALADPEAAALELHRVLRPGGELVILACTSPLTDGSRRSLACLALRGGLGHPVAPRAVGDLPGFVPVAQTTSRQGPSTVLRLRKVTRGCCAPAAPDDPLTLNRGSRLTIGAC